MTQTEMTLGRLKKRPEFLAVNATQQKWVSDTVIVQYKPETPDFKFGVTATKKIGNAVIRNRCKRRLRAAIAEIALETPVNAVNIVMVARPKTATCPWDQLCRDLKWCLKRLGAISA